MINHRSHSDDELAKYLFESGLTVSDFYLEELKGEYTIIMIRPDGKEGLWTIDDDILRNDCINFLKEKKVNIIILC